MSGLASSAFEFGGLRVAPQRSSDLSVTLGSLNPLLPGHVVVAPRRPVARYGDLTAAEADDVAARRARAARRRPPTPSTSRSGRRRRGPGRGALPRAPRAADAGDLPENDLVYGMIDGWTPGGDAAPAVTLDVPPDEARAPRTADDMAAEADARATTAAGDGPEPVGDNGVAVASGPRPAGAVRFGTFALDPRQVFYVSASGLTRAIVNLKPLVPGHVLVVPAKNVP
ncbi:bis(5'-adenosyl)-triphosphatase [Aureococcus anophagefferens]|nr:bis(5'-adenosyl)-triphosphatase [Aureococcus anophagefferens]